MTSVGLNISEAVTDEMVERFCAHMASKGNPEIEWHDHEDDVRAALSVAMRPSNASKATEDALDAYDRLRSWVKVGEEQDSPFDVLEEDVITLLDALKIAWRTPVERPLTEEVLDAAIDAYHAAAGTLCDASGVEAAILSALHPSPDSGKTMAPHHSR